MALASLLLAAGLVLAPTPRLAWAETATTETHEPEVEPLAPDEGVDPEDVPAPAAAEHDSIRHPEDTPGAHDTHAAEPASDPVEDDPGLVSEQGPAFTAIGVTLPHAPSEPVVFRTASNGTWTDWHRFEFSDGHRPDDDPDQESGVTSDVFFVGTADAYEIQVPDLGADPRVHLVSEQRTRVWLEDGTEKAGGATPAIQSRSAWGARAPKKTPREADELVAAAVHHSVTSNGYSSSQVPAILRSIQAYHMDVHGWSDIGYNFAVDRFGRIWEAHAGGTTRAIIGGHSYGFNTATTGVVVLGDYRGSAPSGASLDAVGDVISWKFAIHHTPPSGTVVYRSASNTHFGPAGTPVRIPRVVGHRNVRQTSCPGDALYSRLGSIRNRVVARYATFQASAPPELVPGDRNGDGRDDVLLYRPGSPGDPDWSGQLGPSFSKVTRQVRGLYQVIPGDFDGDGRDDILWYAPGRAPDYVWYGRASGYQNVTTGINGSYEPIVGDFDGDGRDDILWYGIGPAADYVWFGLANDRFADVPTRVSGVYEPFVGDLNGDGRDDVFWYAPGPGGDYLWSGRADRRLGRSSRPERVNGYYQALVGEFDGDESDDIFWYNRNSSADYLWTGSTAGRFTSRPIGRPGVFEPLIGDFDANGRDDFYWFAFGTDRDNQWFTNAQGLSTGRSEASHDVSEAYDPLVGDFDGVTGDDILWHSHWSGRSYVWSFGPGTVLSVQRVD